MEHVAERRPQTVAEMEIEGMRAGIAIAKRLIRGYHETPLKPENPVLVILHGQKIVDDAVNWSRSECGLTDAGEAAFRCGYKRGYDSQLQNPRSKIRIEVVKAN